MKLEIKSARPLTASQKVKLAEKFSGWELEYSIEPKLGLGLELKAGERVIRATGDVFSREATSLLEEVELTSNKEEFLAALSRRIANFQLRPIVEEEGAVLSVGDGIVRISGLSEVAVGELVEFSSQERAMMMNLEEDSVGAVLFGPDSHIQQGDAVRRIGSVISVPVGDELLGRVVNALGEPLDGGEPITARKFRPVEAPAPGIAMRQPVNEPLQTGILAIDAMVPIGKGQRELIIGDRQTGKTTIAVDTILNQKGKNVICIYVGIGQKASTIAQVVSTLREHGALEYSIVVSAAASDPAAMQYLAPYAGCAMAEEFMYRGKDVLIIYDDLSKHAVAYRAISLLLRRPPGREAYPGDVFYLHSRLLERAAKLSDKMGGGSLTALPIVETQAGDVSAYIPTNVISITDGQIILSSELFFSGQRPAVNVGLSVSRVGGDAQIPALRSVSSHLRLDLAQYRELATFAQFGSELDKNTRAVLERGERIERILRQSQHELLSAEDQVMLLYAVVNHYLDAVPLEKINEFKEEFLAFVHHEHPQIGAQIAGSGQLDDLGEEVLKAALAEFVQAFTEEPDHEPDA
jgi:F-type H+-transporting ATPase subunit alpha